MLKIFNLTRFIANIKWIYQQKIILTTHTYTCIQALTPVSNKEIVHAFVSNIQFTFYIEYISLIAFAGVKYGMIFILEI